MSTYSGVPRFLLKAWLVFGISFLAASLGQIVMLFPLWLVSALYIPADFGFAVYAFMGWIAVYSTYNIVVVAQTEVTAEELIEFLMNLGLSGAIRYYGLLIFYINVAVGIGVGLGVLAAGAWTPIFGLIVAIMYPIFELRVAFESGWSPGTLMLRGFLGIFHSVGTLSDVTATSILENLRRDGNPGNQGYPLADSTSV